MRCVQKILSGTSFQDPWREGLLEGSCSLNTTAEEIVGWLKEIENPGAGSTGWLEREAAGNSERTSGHLGARDVRSHKKKALVVLSMTFKRLLGYVFNDVGRCARMPCLRMTEDTFCWFRLHHRASAHPSFHSKVENSFGSSELLKGCCKEEESLKLYASQLVLVLDGNVMLLGAFDELVDLQNSLLGTNDYEANLPNSALLPRSNTPLPSSMATWSTTTTHKSLRGPRGGDDLPQDPTLQCRVLLRRVFLAMEATIPHGSVSLV